MRRIPLCLAARKSADLWMITFAVLVLLRYPTIPWSGVELDSSALVDGLFDYPPWSSIQCGWNKLDLIHMTQLNMSLRSTRILSRWELITRKLVPEPLSSQPHSVTTGMGGLLLFPTCQNQTQLFNSFTNLPAFDSYEDNKQLYLLISVVSF